MELPLQPHIVNPALVCVTGILGLPTYSPTQRAAIDLFEEHVYSVHDPEHLARSDRFEARWGREVYPQIQRCDFCQSLIGQVE